MGRHNYREHIGAGSSPSVKLKKYLYITRPLLCSRWIERDPTAGPPPMPFVDVLNAANVASDLRAAIDALVARKKAAEEIDDHPAVRSSISSSTRTRAWPPSPTPCPNQSAPSRPQ